MQRLNLSDVTQYVESNIDIFHNRRLEALNKLKLKKVLEKKNPYLYKAKNVNTASEIVQGIVDAYLSSSEEGIFGNWLEGLAIFINRKVYGGSKTPAAGLDLDFERDNIRYLVEIKSGPNWGNSGQIKKLVDQFNLARKALKTSGSKVNITCVNGCCYGKSNEKTEYRSKGDYYKICGKRFWELISGDSDLFVKIIDPLGKNATERNEEFKNSYNQLINKFTRQFLTEYCNSDGSINWEQIVKINSEFTVNPKRKKQKK